MRDFTQVQTMPVRDSFLAYRETGSADAPPILLLHGNPTSSLIWRNIVPHLAGSGHCIAPDLIGFGGSGKPDIAYHFLDHAAYLDAFIEAKGISSAYVVAQDWGTALAFHVAARRPDFIRGLAFMEFIRPFASWDDFHNNDVARQTFQAFRTPGVGERLVLDENLFVERVLPGSIQRTLTAEEVQAYREPFPTPESRRPVLAFPRLLPVGGEPADMHALLEAAHAALRASHYPKLLFCGDPGALVSPAFAAEFAAGLVDCDLVRLGSGLHYLQEDHPERIGRSVAHWIAACEARADRAVDSFAMA
jgi:haloalkane dehalogenase